MGISKQDFIALADALKGINPGDKCPSWQSPDKWDGLHFQYEWTLKVLAEALEAQNPNFNRERWLSYIAGDCGPNGGSIKK